MVDIETGAMLKRVLATGVAGLPDLDLDLDPLAALVGPRGSGKSQFLSAIAGRPRAASVRGR